jgi:hypothetical protein
MACLSLGGIKAVIRWISPGEGDIELYGLTTNHYVSPQRLIDVAVNGFQSTGC